MTILALDTSNKTLSVAVELTDGTIIEQTIENTLQHSVLLVPTIEAVFNEARSGKKTSRLETPTSGIPRLFASVLATVTPIRRPV